MRHKRKHPHRSAGTAGELQRRYDEQCPGRRQRGVVRELCDAVLPCPERVVVERERRIEVARSTSVYANGLYTDADKWRLLS